jgi:hypothetical protein
LQNIPEGCLIIAQRFSVGFYGRGAMRPEGTLENSLAFRRPFGTLRSPSVLPNTEVLSYYRMSLLDKAVEA